MLPLQKDSLVLPTISCFYASGKFLNGIMDFVVEPTTSCKFDKLFYERNLQL